MHLPFTVCAPPAARYHKALGGETPAMVGAGLEELFRFVPQLRGDGMEAVVDIFRTICIIGGACQGRAGMQSRG